MRQYFIGDHGRVRTLWRIAIFAAVFAASAFLLIFAAERFLEGAPKGSLLRLAAIAFAALIAVIVARLVLDRKSIGSLGLAIGPASPLDILFGLFVSFLIMAGFFVLNLANGLITFEGFSWWGAGSPDPALFSTVLLTLLARYGLTAFWQELVLRGYVLRNLMDGLGKYFAVFALCVIAGAVHALTPGASLSGNIIAILITLQLIYACLASGRLWLPMGLNLGWHFAQGPVFGFSVNGVETPSLISQMPAGVELLSGGAETSILMIPLLVATFPLIWVYCRGRKKSA